MSARLTLCRSSALLSLAFFLDLAPVPAQSLAPWDRRLEGVAVRPLTPDDPSRLGVQAVLSVSAGPTSAPLDLSTRVEVRVNGATAGTAELDIRAGAAPLGNCAAACAEIGKPCVCVEHIVCGCGDIWILGVPVGTVPLKPGDEITVILYPAPGALPEMDDANDARRIVFRGRESAWERRVAAVRTAPGSKRGLTDVHVAVGAQVNFEGRLDLDTRLELLVNGKPRASGIADFDDFIWASCQGACDGVCAKLNTGDAGALCVQEFHEEGPVCWCNTDQLGVHVFEGVDLQPGDEISVILHPAPGALPDAPPSAPVKPEPEPEVSFRRGDAGGNGTVNMADAVFVLGWLFLGAESPPCPDAADVNDSGEVNIGDPIYLLGWLFVGGPLPPAPGPSHCGADPTADGLADCKYAACLVVQ